jgi:hypothetical protein
VAATHSIPPTDRSEADRADGGVLPPGDAHVETSTACRCGHHEGAHEHYRRGTDCALCPCARYQKERRKKPR